jgi:flagellar FliJ protein
MIDPEQLQMLQKLAKERDDVALRQLARAREALHSAQQQLTLLSRYGDDYHDRLGSEVSGGMDSDTLRNYQAFMLNVGDAVRQQQIEVEKRHQLARTAESAWHESQRQVKSYQALAARGEALSRLANNRQQQRQDDEFAARLARKQLTSA